MCCERTGQAENEKCRTPTSMSFRKTDEAMVLKINFDFEKITISSNFELFSHGYALADLNTSYTNNSGTIRVSNIAVGACELHRQ